MHLVKPRKESLKDEDLQSLVRLCGRSTLHMPADYAPSALVLPTCFRATAQYLVQHGKYAVGCSHVAQLLNPRRYEYSWPVPDSWICPSRHRAIRILLRRARCRQHRQHHSVPEPSSAHQGRRPRCSIHFQEAFSWPTGWYPRLTSSLRCPRRNPQPATWRYRTRAEQEPAEQTPVKADLPRNRDGEVSIPQRVDMRRFRPFKSHWSRG